MKKPSIAVLLAVLFSIGNLPLFAQGGLGSITGAVTDSSQAILPNAVVTIRHLSTGVETRAITNDAGRYSFSGLVVGTYVLSATQPGFQTAERTGLNVVLGESLTVDVELTVGASAQTVTVMGTAVDATSTATGTTVTSLELADVPIQITGTNRNVRDYLSLMPGVMTSPTATDVNNHAQLQGVGDAGASRSIAGYKVDGVFAGGSVNQAIGEGRGQVPIPEQVEEVRLVTNQDAENGGDFGASMEIVLKSGTNRFHGSGFEFMRNEALDARNFFATAVTFDREHEFGGALGGPIKKNKHFFFTTYDKYLRQFAQGGSIQSFPTQKMRSGDFTEWLGPQLGTDVLGRAVLQGMIYDPSSTRADGRGGFIRDPFPGNIIPTSKMSPISTFLQKYYPIPNRAGVQTNWLGVLQNTSSPKEGWNIKTDHDFGPKRLSAFFEYTHDSIIPTIPPTWGPSEINSSRETVEHSFAIRLNYTWNIRPNLLFTARSSVQRGVALTKVAAVASNLGREAGIRGTFTPETPNVGSPGTELEFAL